MKKRKYILIFVVCITSFLIFIFIPKKEKEIIIPETCIRTFKINSMGAEGRDYVEKVRKQESFHSIPLQDNFDPIELDFNEKTIHDEWFLGLSKENGEISVNSDYFSDLVKTDATQITRSTVIGKLKKVIQEDQSFYKKVIVFLLKSHLITTYWHIHSDMCLVSEIDSSEKYTAKFNASHEYCTNECIVEKYSFSIEINKRTGEIILLPE